MVLLTVLILAVKEAMAIRNPSLLQQYYVLKLAEDLPYEKWEVCIKTMEQLYL